MSERDDGGPAFPCMPPQDTGAGQAPGYPYPDAGMSLRDRIMIAALPECMRLLANEGNLTRDGAAASAYGFADAALKERAK